MHRYYMSLIIDFKVMGEISKIISLVEAQQARVLERLHDLERPHEAAMRRYNAMKLDRTAKERARVQWIEEEQLEAKRRLDEQTRLRHQAKWFGIPLASLNPRF